MSNASSEKPKAKNQKLKANFGGPARIILAVLGIFFISQFIAIILIETGLSLFSHSSGTSIERSAVLQFFYILLAEGLVVYGVIWLLRRQGLNLSSIGLGRRPSWNDLKLAAVGVFIFYGLVIATLAILSAFIPAVDPDAVQDVGFNFLNTPLDRAIAFVALVILPPIGEEVLMRGYLYSGLRLSLRFLPATGLTSLFFGLAHLSTGVDGALWAAGVSTFVLSVVLIYLRERTGALYAPIGVHMVNNLFAFFLYIN